MNKKNNIDFIGGTSLIIFSILLGLNQTLVKIVNYGIHPVFQVGLRSLIAAIPVLIFCILFKRRLSIWDGSFIPGIICGLIFAIEFILLFFALEYTSVARSSILFYSMPVWLSIVAHFLFENEKLNFIKVLGFSVSILAVLIALFSREDSIQGNIKGDIFALSASFLWVAIVIIIRTTKLKNSSPEMQLLYQLVVSSILVLPICMYFDFYLREINIQIILIFLFQSLIIVAGGFLIWFWILSIYPASLMASYSFFGPIFGVFFGWFILNEEISIFLLISLLLVCLGIYLININDSK